MTKLYNTSHPLAESGKPIFLPLGEWPYDAKTRQRLDKAHAQAIANTLNERVAGGHPGIPVYQGHPDVPELAPKYPDKGALGWVVKAELANEGGKDGLALTVDWDRDPGKGFKWFSPYWLANERDGNCHIVAEIVSIGLVNNPNIPEFRLANELQGGLNNNERTFTLQQHLIDLAKRYDERVRLANEANYDESKHPRAEDGKWTSGGGGSGGVTVKKVDPKTTPGYKQEQQKNRELDAQVAKNRQRTSEFFAKRANYEAKLQSTIRRAGTRLDHANIINAVFSHYPNDDAAISAAHRTAIYAGLKYNHKLRRYE